MVKCESLRINMFRITHTGKSVNFPVTLFRDVFGKRSSVRGDCLFCTLHLSIEKALRWKEDSRMHSM